MCKPEISLKFFRYMALKDKKIFLISSKSSLIGRRLPLDTANFSESINFITTASFLASSKVSLKRTRLVSSMTSSKHSLISRSVIYELKRSWCNLSILLNIDPIMKKVRSDSPIFLFFFDFGFVGVKSSRSKKCAKLKIESLVPT